MIGILTNDRSAFLPFTRNLAISEAQITWGFSKITIRQTKISSLWGYVKRVANGIEIYTPSPREIPAMPIKVAYVQSALSKAKALSEGEGLFEELEDIEVARTLPDALDALYKLSSAEMLSVDIELDIETKAFLSIAFAAKFSGRFYGVCIPFTTYSTSFWSEEDELTLVEDIFKLLSSEIPKVFQNGIFDCMWLIKWGFEINGPLFDSLIAAHLWNPELPKGLEDLGAFYLLCEPWKRETNWLSTDSLWTYNAKDATRTLGILEQLLALLETDPKRNSFFHSQLVPLSRSVLSMCMRGWTVDTNALAEITAKQEEITDRLSRELVLDATPLLAPDVKYTLRKGKPKSKSIYVQKAGSDWAPYSPPADLKKLSQITPPVYEQVVKRRDFNPRSPVHVADVLKAKGIRIPTLRGKATTDKRALKRILDKTQDPFVSKLMEYRKASKILTTYCRVALDPDGKLRFQTNIAGTVTGRFSSKSTPWDTGFNAQNIPKVFRRICIPSSPDKIIWNVDYKQADPHVVAWLSGETRILSELQKPGGDLHALTGSLIAGRDITSTPGYDKDTSVDRKLGKLLNNGLNYGAQWKKLKAEAFQAGITLSDEKAQELHAAYFNAYPGVKRWHERTQRDLMKTKIIETPQGRRRYFYGNYHDFYSRNELVRQALAYVPPTVVSDCINCAWLRFEALCESLNLKSPVLQQCHDSLMGECLASDWPRVREALIQVFRTVKFNIGEFECLIPIDISSGPNWGSLSSS